MHAEIDGQSDAIIIEAASSKDFPRQLERRPSQSVGKLAAGPQQQARQEGVEGDQRQFGEFSRVGRQRAMMLDQIVEPTLKIMLSNILVLVFAFRLNTATEMPGDGFGNRPKLDSLISGAPKQIGFLPVKEKARIESPEFAKRLATEEHQRAGNPLDSKWRLTGNHEVVIALSLHYSGKRRVDN